MDPVIQGTAFYPVFIWLIFYSAGILYPAGENKTVVTQRASVVEVLERRVLENNLILNK